MITIRAELHVHTVLSPCADLEMLPPLIVAECLQRGIGLIAVTDHNASANTAAVQAAAQGTNLTVLPGMELQTREDVHVLCLFDTLDQVNAWQQIVDSAMPKRQSRSNYFGDQLVVDSNGDFIGRVERLLITSTSLSIDEVWAKVNDLGGLAIPAHVNRSINGLIPMLGKIPENIPFAALEISRNLSPTMALQMFPMIDGFPLLQGGDAHRLDDLLGANEFTIEHPCLAEIKKALHNEDGRSVKLLLPYG